MSEEELLNHLDKASKGNITAARDFYAVLLDSDVYIPLEFGESNKEVVSTANQRFLTINDNARRLIPVFSSQNTLEEWLDFACSVSKRSFKELLYLVANDAWIYFNPGTECGKEFSPWEINLLREQGMGALDEIFAEIDFERPDNISIEALGDEFSELKKQLAIVLESFDQVATGFLVGVREPNQKKQTIALGLKWKGEKGETVKNLHEELLAISEEQRVQGQEMIIVEDLDLSEAFYRQWFDFICPFYYSKEGIKDAGWLKRIFCRKR